MRNSKSCALFFCPNENCKCYGLRRQGNIVKAGIYQTKHAKKQMLKCVCKERFSETRNTIFFHSHYSDATIHNIIRCVSEGNGIRQTSRILHLSKDAQAKLLKKQAVTQNRRCAI